MTLLSKQEVPFAAAAASVDMRALRAAFQRLIDDCVPLVYAAGYDLDDVIVHRFALCQDATDRSGAIAIENLADISSLLRDLQQGAAGAGLDAGKENALRIIGLRVCVVTDIRA